MKHLIKKILKESVDNRIVDLLIKLKLTNYGKIEEFLKETGYNEDEIEEIYSIYFETISGLELNPTNWMDFYFSPDQLEVVNDDSGDSFGTNSCVMVSFKSNNGVWSGEMWINDDENYDFIKF